MMTVHAAKGLEFPVVAVAGLEEGMFPHLRGEKADDREALEEERRLAYVAFTRARKRLYLSFARTRFLAGQRQERERSRFIEEMPRGELQVIRSERQWPEGYGWQGRTGRWEQDGSDPFGQEKGPARQVAQGESFVDRSAYSDLAEEALRPGARVRHRSFGPGLVVKTRPASGSVVVDFPEHGTRTILARFLEPE
jgi:DNA helicase-2/ATP-dependent DNA helicase PcrA